MAFGDLTASSFLTGSSTATTAVPLPFSSRNDTTSSKDSSALDGINGIIADALPAGSVVDVADAVARADGCSWPPLSDMCLLNNQAGKTKETERTKTQKHKCAN